MSENRCIVFGDVIPEGGRCARFDRIGRVCCVQRPADAFHLVDTQALQTAREEWKHEDPRN